MHESSSRVRGWLRDAGRSTLQTVGMIILAGMLVTGIGLAVAPDEVRSTVTRAVCSILQGQNCGSGAGGDLPGSAWDRAQDGRQVALGDSYSSGEGADDYDPATNYDNREFVYQFLWWEVTRDDPLPFIEPKRIEGDDWNFCHRSDNSYSVILNQSLDPAGGFTNVTCSGAETPQLERDHPAYTGEEAQLEALDGDVSVVTMSIGGNDAGFADVITACVTEDDCTTGDAAAAMDTKLDALEEELRIQYDDIRKAVGPDVPVVIVGYPRLWHQPDPDSTEGMSLYGFTLAVGSNPYSQPTYVELGVTVEEQVWMNKTADRLNGIIAAAAERSNVTFVNPTETFQGHGIGSDDPYLNGVEIEMPGENHSQAMPVSPSSIHPNQAGQAAEARLIEERLRAAP